jgi:hypothetical protein
MAQATWTAEVNSMDNVTAFVNDNDNDGYLEKKQQVCTEEMVRPRIHR